MLISPVLLIGVLLRAPGLVVSAMEVPLRAGVAAGAAAHRALAGMTPALEQWTCCHQKGSFASPCKACAGPEQDSGGVLDNARF